MKIEECKTEVLDHIEKCGKNLDFILSEVSLLFKNCSNSVPNDCPNKSDREIKQICIKDGIKKLRAELRITKDIIEDSLKDV